MRVIKTICFGAALIWMTFIAIILMNLAVTNLMLSMY